MPVSTALLPISDFIPTIRLAIPRFRTQVGRPPAPDAQQEACILHPPAMPLQIVAGPGSGKTTVLVLRALRLVIVDGLLPEHVLLTTFTKKAAAEIRTRLIEWGLQLVGYLKQHGPPHLQPHLAQVDVNRFVTGTLDSVCEDALRTLRAATDPAPALLEGFAADALMHRRGLTNTVYNNGTIDPAVASFLANFTFDGTAPRNVGDLIRSVRPLFDRFAHDIINLPAFQALPTHTGARALLVRGYSAYMQHLRDTNRLDFALLEQAFLERLRAGRLTRFTDVVRAILVDEYQDTNLLQESIYFELFRRTHGSLSVVGDDDQSLYRFRGATVELFRDFRTRLAAVVPNIAAQRLDLIANYRSTPELVSFFNSFIVNDPDFSPARVQPPKPAIRAQLPSNGARVMGMFRSDVSTLATDLAAFLYDVFRGNGRAVSGTMGQVTIAKAPQGGDFGDAVLLSHSVNEFTSGFMGSTPRARLPHELRRELAVRNVGVFNPRGQALRDIPVIRQLVGAMLECLDPGAVLQSAMRLRGEAQQYLSLFRDAYTQYAGTNPLPVHPHGLSAFASAWRRRQSQSGNPWPREWPILELCFTLLAWFPNLRDDPEGQVHLEAVTRAISQSATFSPYRALVLHGSGQHDRISVENALRDIFAPIAESSIDVDEEIMPSVPRDRFAMMTIHQAKGLEFPLVIVDVGSDFKTNHAKTRFRRFPDKPSNVTQLEDELAPSCSVGTLRLQRTALQRTFEDLIRLYYVAYSRPQSALLLVGLDTCLQYSTSIRHTATFWRADGTWDWRTPYSGQRHPPQANNLPLELI
ncbi:ATP-dependent helicase [Corallococcus aberystwythensis]|uniref:DNA 3'-5' helicase n=1 Tax=Corallococcus aberystwythensis TaxID=2316722 RepID=A0A3A8QV38_9BACT|nr:ATP-dependent helicase [Corallococcus aberystwythensis]